MCKVRISSFLVATVLLSMSLAEPPRTFVSRQRFSRLEAAPAQPPSTSYGAPQQSYGPPMEPAPSYGPPMEPAPSYGPPPASSTTEVSITTDANSEPITELPSVETSSKLRDGGNFYYIYHPNGALEKLSLRPSNIFNSRLVQRRDEPIRGAIYTYDANSYVLRRI